MRSIRSLTVAGYASLAPAHICSLHLLQMHLLRARLARFLPVQSVAELVHCMQALLSPQSIGRAVVSTRTLYPSGLVLILAWYTLRLLAYMQPNIVPSKGCAGYPARSLVLASCRLLPFCPYPHVFPGHPLHDQVHPSFLH